jgi:hypothetical protein
MRRDAGLLVLVALACAAWGECVASLSNHSRGLLLLLLQCAGWLPCLEVCAHDETHSPFVTGPAAASPPGNSTGVILVPHRDPFALLGPEAREEHLLHTQGTFFVWNHERRFLGCIVPKIGCSSWIHFLRTMLLPKDIMDQIKRLRQVYRPQSFDAYGLHFRANSQRDLDTFARIASDPAYFKWAVVRHPWDRLVSAYRSKYEGFCEYSRVCLREKFGFALPPADDNRSLSFHDFVATIAATAPERLDRHVRPVVLMCGLDAIGYNFLGDLGSHKQMDALSERLGFARRFSTLENRKAARTFGARYYGGRTHKVQPCSRDTVVLAARVYAKDAAAGGYTFAEAMRACTEHGRSAPPAPRHG